MIWRLHPWLNKARSILELGAGFGGLARAILKRWPDMKIALVDLDPMLRIQEYYLRNTTYRGASIRFLPAFPPESFDVIIATRMMCELDIGEVNIYLKSIDRAIDSGVFYCIFHEKCINRYAGWRIPSWWVALVDDIFPFGNRELKQWREKIWLRKHEVRGGS